MHLLLSTEEIEALTGYRRPHEQITELHRQGFHRARRNRLGQVVLERGHYDSVVAARAGAVEEPGRPKVRLLKKAA